MKKLTNDIIRKDLFAKYILSEILSFIFKIIGIIVFIIIVIYIPKTITLVGILLISLSLFCIAIMIVDRKNVNLLLMGYWECVNAKARIEKENMPLGDGKIIPIEYIKFSTEYGIITMGGSITNINWAGDTSEKDVFLVLKKYPVKLIRFDKDTRKCLLVYDKMCFGVYEDDSVKDVPSVSMSIKELNDADIKNDINYKKIKKGINYIIIFCIMFFVSLLISCMIFGDSFGKSNHSIKLFFGFIIAVIGLLLWYRRKKINTSIEIEQKDYDKEYNIVNIDDKIFALIREDDYGNKELIKTYNKNKYKYIGTKY